MNVKQITTAAIFALILTSPLSYGFQSEMTFTEIEKEVSLRLAHGGNLEQIIDEAIRSDVQVVRLTVALLLAGEDEGRVVQLMINRGANPKIVISAALGVAGTSEKTIVAAAIEAGVKAEIVITVAIETGVKPAVVQKAAIVSGVSEAIISETITKLDDIESTGATDEADADTDSTTEDSIDVTPTTISDGTASSS